MKTVCAVLLAGALTATGAAAQETGESKEASPAPREQGRPPQIPLSVHVLLTRHAGERVISRLPYTMTVTAGRPDWTRLRMGVEVPVVTSMGDAAAKSVQYRSVGVNIDCMASRQTDGAFNLVLTVEQSSVDVAEGERRGGALADAPLGTQPMFRTFKINLNPILRDGQSQVFTVAADPVSGEQSRVEVAVNLIK